MTDITFLGNGKKERVRSIEIRVSPDAKLWFYITLESGKSFETSVLGRGGIE